ncbi:hypothetical protein [Mucilaginibacter sp. L196]|uniref:hypothetical protein n=1 Tax=Mucilaginibacter sp. L196 TaxID=1641870 RepID=UPI00131B7373|nr:hypothetical protein [Mucilaginibacter sp. L196]
MKNFKKIALGLLVGALAIGFSSFTNAKRNTTYTFAHIAHSTSNTKADYKYRGDLAGCDESTNICTADWSQSTVPTENSNPSPSASEVDTNPGDYQGN